MRYVRSFLVLLVLPIWCSLLIAQEDATVYVTKTGSKYHSAGCSYLSRSSIEMKLAQVGTRYTPCSRCNPPTVSSAKVQAGGELKKLETTSATPAVATPPKSSTGKETVIGTTPTGKTLYQGPRGGTYHYSKSGKKVYQRKKK